MTQVEFGTDSETIISSSDDGRITVWEWRSGIVLNSCMRHPAAVRTFDFNYDRSHMVVCGRNDGHVTVWNTNASVRMDEIEPDPTWSHSNDMTDTIILDKEKNHCGAILCVKLSLDKQLLATCSTDQTCKLWRVSSYQKDFIQIKSQFKECDTASQLLDGYIDVLNKEFDSQLQFQEKQVLKLGEVPISSGYHADLRFTFQHEAPVLTCAFTVNSEYSND